ncbi:MAG: hypothetical protein HYU63_04760 [Armatimonadetes bacterium]|nr:hypothetical protein [Armatimonadota bacterium]
MKIDGFSPRDDKKIKLSLPLNPRFNKLKDINKLKNCYKVKLSKNNNPGINSEDLILFQALVLKSKIPGETLAVIPNIITVLPCKSVKNIDGINKVDFKLYNEIIPQEVYRSRGINELYYSNSPEFIKLSENNPQGEGILADNILREGKNRLFFHHVNETKEEKNLVLAFYNGSEKEATLKIKKSGISKGSKENAAEWGRKAYEDYLNSSQEVTLKIPSHSWEYLPQSKFSSGENISGILEIENSSTLRLQSIAAAQDQVEYDLKKLPTFKSDGRHIRGIFNNPDQIISAQFDMNGEIKQFILGNNDWIKGKDLSDGYQEVKNKGNYGSNYHLKFKIKRSFGDKFKSLVILAVASGGPASILDKGNNLNGKPVLLHTKKNLIEGIVIYNQEIPEGETKISLDFMPSGGTNLPVRLIFIPLP